MRLFIIPTVFILSACASTPPVKFNYYHAKSTVNFDVARSVTCKPTPEPKKGKPKIPASEPVIVTTVTATVLHNADLDSPNPIDISKLDGSFSNTDFTIQFYDDGRLKGISSSSTGQGEAIVKSAASIASGLAIRSTADCDYIGKKGGENKTLTLNYAGSIAVAKHFDPNTSQLSFVAGFDGQGSPISRVELLPKDIASRAHNRALANTLGKVFAQPVQGSIQAPERPATVSGQNWNSANNGVDLQLRQPGLLQFAVKVQQDSKPIWTGVFPIGQVGTDYRLPIPKGAVFGKQNFGISIAESGAVTSIQYAKDTGIGQTLNGAQAVLDEFRGQTPAEKLTELKTQADLIAAQERLARCIADASSC